VAEDTQENDMKCTILANGQWSQPAGLGLERRTARKTILETGKLIKAEASRSACKLQDNPRRLGKGWARLVGAAPLKSIEGYDSGGRIHQFLWRCSRIVSTREKGTARSGAMRSRFEPS
jgi:hypothetical protein